MDLSTYFPQDPRHLLALLSRLFVGFDLRARDSAKMGRLLGLVVPHASIEVSGNVAARGYYQLVLERRPHTIVIVSPSHYGARYAVSVAVEGMMCTPIGCLDIDTDVASWFVDRNLGFFNDPETVYSEHGILVQLPFIQFVYEFVMGVEPPSIVPIVVADQRFGNVARLADKLVFVKRSYRDVIIIATSDLSHYKPDDVARGIDLLLIDRILNLDPVGLYRVDERMRAGMCGVGAVASLLLVANRLGNCRARLLGYGTSSEATGIRDSVVGFASIAIERA